MTQQSIKNGRYGYGASHIPKWSIEAIMEYDDTDFTIEQATNQYIEALQNIINYQKDWLIHKVGEEKEKT